MGSTGAPGGAEAEAAQCPVCTLYLHAGMTLESHLDTHPKEQVIRALCSTLRASTPASRCSTPRSERTPRRRASPPLPHPHAPLDEPKYSASAEYTPYDPYAAYPAHYWREEPPPALYHNVMVVNPYPPAACLYAPERHHAPAPVPASSQPLVIEVGPGPAPTPADAPEDSSLGRKGLKILSNIKVEVPIQHHKNLLHAGVVDLTAEPDPAPPLNTPSVIRNVGRPPPPPPPPASPPRALHLNNIFLKKHKRVLQIKNAKPEPPEWVEPLPEEPPPPAPAQLFTDACYLTEYASYWGGAHKSEAGAGGGWPEDEEAQYEELRAGVRVDISADERMPPRGELSGQESNDHDPEPEHDHEHEPAPALQPPPDPPHSIEPPMYLELSAAYELLARDAWPEGATSTKPEPPPEPEPDPEPEPEPAPAPELHMVLEDSGRRYACSTCHLAFTCPKERRVHRSRAHPASPHTPASPAPVEPPTPPALVKLEEGASAVKVEAVAGTRRRRSYQCGVCGERAPNEAAYTQHLRVHPLECLTCGKYFYRRANLRLHINTHLDIRNYKCEQCGKAFITRQKLREHHNTHTGLAPVKCTHPHCERAFRRHSNMVQHRKRHHGTGTSNTRTRRELVCWCGEVCGSARKLAWHRETHAARPHACPHCSDKFVHAASLTRHVRRAHDPNYLPAGRRDHENAACPLCKRVFLRGNLAAHVRSHAGVRAHRCAQCDKAFTTAWNLKLHRWTHASRSSKPHRCMTTGCSAAFHRRAELVAHGHAHRAHRPYTCNHCGRRFIRKYNCARHVREHETPPRHACAVPGCGKRFHRSYYLTEHMRVHSGARPHACAVCGKTSANKSNHNKHLRIHHARDPHPAET